MHLQYPYQVIIRQSNIIRVSNSGDTTLVTQTFVDKAVKGTQVIGVDYTVFNSGFICC